MVVEQVDVVSEMVYKTYFFKCMPKMNNAALATCFTMEGQHKYQDDLYFTEAFGFAQLHVKTIASVVHPPFTSQTHTKD